MEDTSREASLIGVEEIVMGRANCRRPRLRGTSHLLLDPGPSFIHVVILLDLYPVLMWLQYKVKSDPILEDIEEQFFTEVFFL